MTPIGLYGSNEDQWLLSMKERRDIRGGRTVSGWLTMVGSGKLAVY